VSIYGPYNAKVVDVHDGDTVIFDIDLGFGQFLLGRDWDGHPLLSCRVVARSLDMSGVGYNYTYRGINAPELSTPEGKIATSYAKALLHTGEIVQVYSTGWDKYGGRFDGAITLVDGADFGTTMMNAGHAMYKDYS
jgi:endonuclease YncB( thermonuclease family)